ncbi:hypothetical protein [Azospirillum argentinense]
MSVGPAAGFLARGSSPRLPPSRPVGPWHVRRPTRRIQLRGQPRPWTPSGSAPHSLLSPRLHGGRGTVGGAELQADPRFASGHLAPGSRTAEPGTLRPCRRWCVGGSVQSVRKADTPDGVGHPRSHRGK